MKIKKRITVSLALSMSFAFISILLILYLISSRILERRIVETYRLAYDNYRQIIEREEENLYIFTSYSYPSSTYYYIEKLPDTKCEEVAYYRVTSAGPYYGINRNYPEGCFFIGINLEEILRFMQKLMDIDWVVYYNRDIILEIAEGNLGTFMKDKLFISNIIIDRFSKQYVITLPLDVKGYTLYGSFPEKFLLTEVPLKNMKGLPIGRVILVKDVSSLYIETYKFFLVLALYLVFVLSFLSIVLFRMISTVVNRVIFLKDITASIEKQDFTVVQFLENSKEAWKDEIYELKHSIYNMALSLKSAFEELEKKRVQLEELAYYDPLTELPNRRFFFDNANLIFEGSKRYGNPLSLLIIDIDHFKKINDIYGYEAGDLVLKSFADIFRRNIRQSDLPARFGGEEFLLLMPDTDLQEGRTVAERLRSVFQDSLIVYEGKEIRATLSGGLASYKAGVESIDDLIRIAYEALYKAKELGRNRIEVYDT